MASQKGPPFAIDVPRAEDDRPQWIRVGIIAAVGFAIGIAWPRIAGIRLGPSAPGENPTNAGIRATEPPPPASAPTPTPAVLATPAPSASSAPSASASPTPSGPPHVVVQRGAVLSCKTDEGEALKGSTACGGLAGFDAIAQPRIRRVKDCSAAEGATGKLSIMFFLDFPNNRINVEIGKSSSLANLESIGACVKQQFLGVSLGAVTHEHPRYSMAYNAMLSPSDATAQAGASNASPGAAPAVSVDAPTSSVVWEVAIVRDAPRSGQVVGRVQRGTKVKVGQGQENWYRVRYGAGFASEGWVYRGAIGK
jgi:hypothetical protein